MNGAFKERDKSIVTLILADDTGSGLYPHFFAYILEPNDYLFSSKTPRTLDHKYGGILTGPLLAYIIVFLM